MCCWRRTFFFRLEFSPADAEARRAVRGDGFRACNPAFLLPLEQHPGTTRCSIGRAWAICVARASSRGETLRMLADPRAEALLDNFADQWLGLRTLDELKPDEKAYPAFDSSLRDAFEHEHAIVPPKHLEGEPQSDRSSRCGLHLSKRKVGSKLWDSRRHRTWISPRHSEGASRKRRIACAGVGPDGDVAQRQDVPGPAWRLGPGQPAQLPPARGRRRTFQRWTKAWSRGRKLTTRASKSSVIGPTRGVRRVMLASIRSASL